MNKATTNKCGHVFVVVVCENMFLLYLDKLQGVKLLGDSVKAYVKLYKGLSNLLCINFYDIIIHITCFHSNILDKSLETQKTHSETSSNGFPHTAHLCDKTSNYLRWSWLLDHLKNSFSFSSVCCYASLITHPLKFSPS